jgi:2-phospho-L-lactate guanylyltransferase
MPAVEPVLLVPVKDFSAAKARLSTVLPAPERAQLARWMAERVLAAAGELPVFVTCDDHDVAAWAEQHGATVLFQPGVGLNPAVNASIATLRDSGVQQVVVAHGDLPRASSLAGLARTGVLTLVPDRHGDGTNVASVPTTCGFELAYGPGSFRRHLDAALLLGLHVEVRHDPLLALDIDTPDDLAHPLVQEVLPPWLPTNPVNPLSHRTR